MSIWVNIFCQRSVESVRPNDLIRGIEKRLAVMTYLLLPEEEEEPASVSKRLKIEATQRGEPFRRLQIHYRTDGDQFLVMERWTNSEAVFEEVKEFLERLEKRSESAAERIRDHLRETIESIGIELKASDARSMGWPVAICAAAEIAERGDGIIHAGGSGWMVPSGNEVDIILAE